MILFSFMSHKLCVKFSEGIKFLFFLSEIDAGMKAVVDFGKNDLLPHFIYCKGDYFYGEEKILKEILLAKMYDHGIQSSIITELKMLRRNMIIKEKATAGAEGLLQNEPEWKRCEGSVNDDLEAFLIKLLHQEEIDNERVVSFHLATLTEKELQLVDDKNSEYMTTFLLQNPDVDAKEMAISDSCDKFVHGQCCRNTYHLNIGSNQFENEEFVQMTETNQIGVGGFGMVFKGFFNGEEKAMKCVWIGQTNDADEEALRDTLDENHQNEMRIQVASGGSGILVPEAFVRQQDREQDDNGEWITNNYIIFIYPRYDCNLYEFHQNHYDQFTDDILREIMQQCLTRKCSNSQKNSQTIVFLNKDAGKNNNGFL